MDYCYKWGLEINMKKTKVLIFNNTGRISIEKFTFNGQLINNEKKYNYLGIIFTVSGRFTDAKFNLYNKALKAFFKLKRYFTNFKPNIKTLLHLFDHILKPILLYGSEIWGQFSPNKLQSKGDNYFFQMCKDLVIEKLHVKFGKYSLQVRRRSTNLAVMGELGRYPLSLEVILNMTKFWVRLSEQNNSLIKEAFEESKILSKKCKDNWLGSIYSLFKYLNLTPEYLLNHKSHIKSIIIKKL